MRIVGDQHDELIQGLQTSSLPAPPQPGGLVLLTSGTTGTPKGAPRNKIDPLQSAQVLDRIPWPRNGTYCVAAPLFHATGLATCALALAMGNRVVVARRFDPEATVKSIAEHRASTLILVPTMLQRILDLGPEVLAKYDTTSLEVVFAAGSSLSPDLCRRTDDAFGAVLYNLYGSTEVAVAAVATPQELRRAPGTVGRPPLGCTLVAYDEQRRRIAEPGRVGTLFVSSGLSFSGYTDGGHKEIVDGLLSTGDTGHFDETGLWFVDGRDDDMIVSGGENVFPLEVENLLADHPGVVEAAVIGVDDAEFGKRLAAFVVSQAESALGRRRAQVVRACSLGPTQDSARCRVHRPVAAQRDRQGAAKEADRTLSERQPARVGAPASRQPSKSLERQGFPSRPWWARRLPTPPRPRSCRRIRGGSAPATASRG